MQRTCYHKRSIRIGQQFKEKYTIIEYKCLDCGMLYEKKRVY